MQSSSNTVVIYLARYAEDRALLQEIHRATAIIARSGVNGFEFAKQFPMLMELKQILHDEANEGQDD